MCGSQQQGEQSMQKQQWQKPAAAGAIHAEAVLAEAATACYPVHMPRPHLMSYTTPL